MEILPVMHPDHLPVPTAAQRATHLAGRVLGFPLLRLVWTALLFFGLYWALGRLAPSIARLGNETLGGAFCNAILSLAVLWTTVRLFEGRQLDVVGLPLRGALSAFGRGYFIGAALLTAVTAVLWVVGCYQVTGLGAGATAPAVGRAALLFFLVGVAEEVLTRGILFRLLEQGLGTWAALGLSAVLFGLGHRGNPGATTQSSLALALEAGVLLAAAYVATRSLWLPIGLHAAWDFFEGPVYGAHVSGIALPSVLQASFPGPAWLTGGAFGPEAGVPAVVLGTALGTAFLVLAWRRGHVFTPRWLRRLLRRGGPPAVSAPAVPPGAVADAALPAAPPQR